MKVKTQGKVWVVSGSSRNGKSVCVQSEIMDFDFILVWDVDGEYTKNEWPEGGLVTVNDLNSLYTLISEKGNKPLRIAFQPASLEVFDDFCEMAIAWGTDIQAAGVGELAVVVEETADISSPGKATGNFRILIGRGMKRGITLFCVTQRPSESEKTSLGNAKYIVTYYMTRDNDKNYMAKEIGCKPEDIDELAPYYYLKKDVDNRKIIHGTIDLG